MKAALAASPLKAHLCMYVSSQNTDSYVLRTFLNHKKAFSLAQRDGNLNMNHVCLKECSSIAVLPGICFTDQFSITLIRL